MGAYNNALSLNKQNYSNILGGYQTALQSQQAVQQGIQQGYATLSSNVLGTIQGIDASQRQAIRDQYAMQAGQTAQGLINRGLGNTTVANSMQRGVAADRAKADIALTNQTQQLNAGYQSNLGLAGLNYANQANTQNTALRSQQLGWMNSINSPYPDPMKYSMLAQQKGAVQAGLGGIGAFGARGGGGGTPMSSGAMFSAGTPNNYGGGSAAMQSSMGMRNGALGQRAAAPMDFGDQQAYSPYGDANYGLEGDQAYVGNTGAQEQPYYAEDFMNETPDYGGGDQSYYADNSFMNETPDYAQGDQGGYGQDYSWMDQYAGQEGFDPNEYY
jgi:hypothetical protein